MTELSVLNELLEQVCDLQANVCCYGTRDGDGRSCDCKFVNLYDHSGDEVTGCCEYRTVARLIRRKIAELDGDEETKNRYDFYLNNFGPWCRSEDE